MSIFSALGSIARLGAGLVGLANRVAGWMQSRRDERVGRLKERSEQRERADEVQDRIDGVKPAGSDDQLDRMRKHEW